MDIKTALQRSRNASGRSQEYMAYELGVSRRTIRNWESGRSEPTIGEAMAWFRVMNKNPIPFLLQCAFPDMEGIAPTDSDPELRASLRDIVDQLPAEAVRELLYLFYGNHGSSPRAALNLLTAHLQTPLDDRVTQAGVILHNYEMAADLGRLTRPTHIQPDLPCLHAAIEAGRRAVLDEDNEYTLGGESEGK